ncbi:MAG: hypothetical protein R2851_17800 [Caldilineaceae bacterium]
MDYGLVRDFVGMLRGEAHGPSITGEDGLAALGGGVGGVSSGREEMPIKLNSKIKDGRFGRLPIGTN